MRGVGLVSQGSRDTGSHRLLAVAFQRTGAAVYRTWRSHLFGKSASYW